MRRMHSTPERLAKIWQAARDFVRACPISEYERSKILETEWGPGCLVVKPKKENR
jgi:hypothetical protein